MKARHLPLLLALAVLPSCSGVLNNLAKPENFYRIGEIYRHGKDLYEDVKPIEVEPAK